MYITSQWKLSIICFKQHINNPSYFIRSRHKSTIVQIYIFFAKESEDSDPHSLEIV